MAPPEENNFLLSWLKPIAGWLIIWGMLFSLLAVGWVLSHPAGKHKCPETSGSQNASVTLLYFYSEICPACFLQAGNLGAFIQENVSLRLDAYDTRSCPAEGRTYGILGTPAAVFVGKNQSRSATLYGVQPPSELMNQYCVVAGC